MQNQRRRSAVPYHVFGFAYAIKCDSQDVANMVILKHNNDADISLKKRELLYVCHILTVHSLNVHILTTKMSNPTHTRKRSFSKPLL